MEMSEPLWSQVVNDEDRGGAFIPIFALACEDHSDPRDASVERTPDQGTAQGRPRRDDRWG
jgi:hypothetical protein